MSFILHHAVVHQLVKEQHKTAKSYNDRKAVLDSQNDLVIELAEKVAALYQTKNNMATHGVFNPKITKKDSFPILFKKYYSLKTKPEETFLELSLHIMDKIQDEYADIVLATGGYVFIAEYSNNTGRYLYVVIIKQKDSYVLNQSLDPEIFETLDLTKLNQAIRINYTRYKNKIETPDEDINYLSFVSSSASTAVSDYFIKALGCNKNISASKMTDNVIKLSSDYFKDDEDLKEESVNIKNDIIEYLSGCIQKEKPARLDEIETVIKKRIETLQLDNDVIEKKVQGLLSKFNSDDIGISSEFNVFPGVIKKYTRVIYKGDTYSFNFETQLLSENPDSDVYFNSDENQLIFSNLTSKAIAVIEKAIAENKV